MSAQGSPLPRALRSPGLRRLFEEARRALEARGVEGARAITLREATGEERRAIADLHGWRELPPAEVPLRIDLSKLDAVLRQSAAAAGLVQVIELLTGPLQDLRANRALAQSEREAFWSWVREHEVVKARPALQRWADELRAAGLVGRLASLSGLTERELIDRTLAVIARLPARESTLPVFAAELLGDAHALDPGRPEATLVLRAAALLSGREAVPDGAAERRLLWSQMGVACDTLSSDVLTLGLWPEGEGRLARHLRESSADGEPRRITLRELASQPVRLALGSVVFACENPSIVQAAADRLGGACAPLICIEGHPSTAALRLLQEVAAAGAQVQVRADFDWAGIGILNLLLERVPGAAPWRMARDDYERAAGSAAERRIPLVGRAVEASWDEGLSRAMASRGHGVLEEHLVEELLGDLSRRG